ncbi:MAG: hypothetical protein NTW21_33420 [Verrucomicrobia bacterium]|nr:hypothetical protein [Verrucomicrobiota bacterium]
MKSIILITPVILAIHLPAGAQQSTANTTAYRASVSQNQLRNSTERMKAELAAIIRDYERYEIASLEIAKLKESVASLDQLASRDMPDVVRILLDASHAADPAIARGQLTQANGGQTEIQTRLRILADQLASYSDQAAMQQRIEEVALRQAANLRATTYLTKQLAELGLTLQEIEKDPATNPPLSDRDDREAIRARERKQNLWADLVRRKLEQTALEQEIRLAVAALARVAADPTAAAATHFTQALQASQAGKLDDHSQQATGAMKEDLQRAASEQKAVFTALQAMIASLDGVKSDEDRLRDIATQLGDLSLKEDSLATRTPRMWGDQKKRATQDQLATADHLEVLQNRLQALTTDVATKAGQAATRAGEIGDQIRPENFTDNVPLVTKTAADQMALARDLTAMARALEHQADQLAAKNAANRAPPPQPAPMSPEAAAIQEAMRQLVDARINVELAGRQNSDHSDYQPRLAQGRQNLSAGTEQAREAGSVVNENVHQALAEADRLAQLAADGKLVDHHLYHTRANINVALAGLQEAAIELAAKEAKDQADMQGESVTRSGSQGGGPFYSALSDASDAQRDALSLLKQEKTAPEFETMVNQYIKNLAEEPDADR